MKSVDYLGHLRDELEEVGSGFFTQEFVSNGPKNYAFSVYCPSTGKHETKCKVKRINSNYENANIVNLTTLRNIILKDTTPAHEHNAKKIKRKHGGVVVSEPETKEYKVVVKKGRLMSNFDSLPYGYH